MDQAADRKIRSYTIRCPRRSRGCQWKGELRAKEVRYLPKRNFATVNLIERSIRKSSANYANYYTDSTKKFCTCFNHVICNCIDEAKRAKANKVQLLEERLVRQHGRLLFDFLYV